MAAETFLSPVIEKLNELLAKEVKSLKGVHKEVESLHDELEIIQPFLRDAEAKTEKGEAAKVWLKQLRDKAECIEDVVDAYFYHLAHHHRQRGFIGSLQKAGDCIKTLNPRYDIASEIRDIKESLREIKERGQSYGLRPFEQEAGDERVDPRLSSLFIDEDALVGIDSKSKELISNLLEGQSRRTVISLVGQGGIGKTTLASKVYNDQVLKGHFDCSAWITVSQSYKMETVLKIMKNQICPEKKQPMVEIGAIKELIDLLRSCLQTKRYVVVFDDVWQLDFWDSIKHALPSNDKGSRIIFTTRNTSIAYYVKETPGDLVQELKTWSPELAWELFCKRAFTFEFEGRCPQKLDQLSREIIKKCQGLPLVIAAVAGLLSTKKKTEFECKEFLKLLATKDYSVFDQRLYRLWIAEGFIKVKRGKTLEEVAEGYLSELIHRNLVSVEIKFGFERWCRIHDLIREIILTKADEFNFFEILNENQSRFKGRSRRLSIHGTTKDILKGVGDSKIRSVFLFNVDKLTETFVISLFENFRLLKVLDFEDASLDNLPKKVGKLYNLRYLSLGCKNVKVLPKSIGKLHNLLTLDLMGTSVQELPIEVRKLGKLRHLRAFPESNLKVEASCASIQGISMHKGIGCLEELQMLCSVEAYPNIGFVKELERLRNLKVLETTKLSAEVGKVLGASIEKMKTLEELYLTSANEDVILDLKSLSSPPPLLRALNLRCRLEQLPDWISKLQNLKGLDLIFSRLIHNPLEWLKGLEKLAYLCMYQAYDGEELHFEEGGFQKLKHLRLRNLDGLKVVKIEREALPLLEELEFGSFPLMEEMPSDIQHLTSLKSLQVFDMPRKFVAALQPHGGPHYSKIQHVPSVTFGYKIEAWNYKTYKLGGSKLLKLLKE